MASQTQVLPTADDGSPSAVRAAVCRAFGQPMEIQNLQLAAPGPDEIEIAVKCCAICHSDIAYASGIWGGTLPAVYGHEASGIVLRAGAQVSGFQPGDHVLATLIRSCGDCHYCADEVHVMCEHDFDQGDASALVSSEGTPILKAMAVGGFADRVVVHKSQVAAVPNTMPFDEASLLSCGVITGYGALANTAGMRPGKSVAVIGCGGVGFNTLQAARMLGAGTVIALDLSAEKLAAAKAFGADHGFLADKEGVADHVRSLTGGRGVDYAVVTVGATQAIEQALGLVARNGKVVIVGMPATGAVAQFEAATMASDNISIVGSKMGETVLSRDIPLLVEAWERGELNLRGLVSKRWPLESINEAIADVLAGGAIRNVIDMTLPPGEIEDGAMPAGGR